GEGVERIFPVHSPRIAKIVIKKAGKVRRAKLYYLRDRVGKATKIKDDTKRQLKIDADLKAAAEATARAAQEAAARATAEGGVSGPRPVTCGSSATASWRRTWPTRRANSI